MRYFVTFESILSRKFHENLFPLWSILSLNVSFDLFPKSTSYISRQFLRYQNFKTKNVHSNRKLHSIPLVASISTAIHFPFRNRVLLTIKYHLIGNSKFFSFPGTWFLIFVLAISSNDCLSFLLRKRKLKLYRHVRNLKLLSLPESPRFKTLARRCTLNNSITLHILYYRHDENEAELHRKIKKWL